FVHRNESGESRRAAASRDEVALRDVGARDFSIHGSQYLGMFQVELSRRQFSLGASQFGGCHAGGVALFFELLSCNGITVQQTLGASQLACCIRYPRLSCGKRGFSPSHSSAIGPGVNGEKDIPCTNEGPIVKMYFFDCPGHLRADGDV